MSPELDPEDDEVLELPDVSLGLLGLLGVVLGLVLGVVALVPVAEPVSAVPASDRIREG